MKKTRHTLDFVPVYSPDAILKSQLDDLAELYRIEGPIATDELIPLAEELETLDYVVYCSVTPDTTLLPPPRIGSEGEVTSLADTSGESMTRAETPDFTADQNYLGYEFLGSNPFARWFGMNVREAWKMGATGLGARVHHLDFGVYRGHEDLQNITVVHSRPETEDCNHGTASAGCIAATKNDFGVTGAAYDCKLYFYDTDDLDRIVERAEEGDIVGLDIQIGSGYFLLPMIAVASWWDKISLLSRRRVTVILAAGNGGMDLSTSDLLPDYGDSGSMLAGACVVATGRRDASSNYGHETSLVNSWGSHVTTTGYGDLYGWPTPARSYTFQFSGTSSATPLAVGAVAVIQGYAMSHLGLVLHPPYIRQLLAETGSTQAVADKIGYRPNVARAVQLLRERFE